MKMASVTVERTYEVLASHRSGPPSGFALRSSRQERWIVNEDRYKMFGEVALAHKFVTAEKLYEALTVQARDKAEGRPERLLGQILLEMGYMDADEVSRVLDVLYPAKESVD